MDETFELASSMSPKLKNRNRKTTKKAPTKLALRKHFRRSLILDNLPNTKNEQPYFDHEASTSSSSTFDDKDSKKSLVEIDRDCKGSIIEDSFESSRKFQYVKNWVESMPSKKLWLDKPELDDFDDLMRNVCENEIGKKQLTEGFNQNGEKCQNGCSNSTDESDVIVIEDSFIEIKDSFQETSSESCNDKGSPENILDEVHGTSWRENKDSLLTLSEPSHKKEKQFVPCNIAQTERKENPRLKLHKQIFQKAKMMQNLESPKIDGRIGRQKLDFSDDEDEKEDVATDSKDLSESERLLDQIYGKSWRSKKEEVMTPVKQKGDVSDILIKKYLGESKSDDRFKYVTPRRKKTANNVMNEWRPDLTKENLREEEEKLAIDLVNRFNTSIGKERQDTEDKADETDRDSLKNIAGSVTSKAWRRNRVFSTSSEESKNSVSSIESDTKLKRVNDFLYDRFLNTDKKNKAPVISNTDADGAFPSFLASLSSNIKIGDIKLKYRPFRTNFADNKAILAKKLFVFFNEHVFENKLPVDTPLEWNDRMRGTAGFCRCKKITRRTGVLERHCRIELATKVIDSADRLRDTLVHEMCHAASFIINEVVDGHGPFWQAWANKAMKKFPELPPIRRCHDYAINTKYSYVCTSCSYTIGRHSKSLDVERKRCGYCYGKFEVFINKKKGGVEVKVPAKSTKELNGFALFVKENYGLVKQPNMSHKDVMRVLGEKFSSMKVKEK